MKSTRFLLSLAAVLLLSSASGYAQGTPGILSAVGDEKGILPYGSYHGGDIDQVDLKNGNLVIDIPLFSLPQLGKLKLSFSLQFNSQGFDVEDSCGFADDGCGEIYYRSGPIGPVLTMDQALYVETLAPSLDVPPGTHSFLPPTFTIFDGTGATHPMMFDYANWNNLHALDGSGYSFYAVPGSAPYNPYGDGTDDPSFDYSACTGDTPYAQADGDTAATSDGIMHTQQEGCWGPDTPAPPILMKDPNGNQIIYNTTGQQVGLSPDGLYIGYVSGFGSVTDSVNRMIPDFNQIAHSDTSMCPNVGSSQPAPTYSKTWIVPGPNGTPANYIFCMTNVTYNTHFGPQTFLPEGESSYDPQAIGEGDAIQSVILPNGKYWGFLYDNAGTLATYEGGGYDAPDTVGVGYGNVTEILLPTGGSISYTYITRESCSTESQFKRYVKTRTVNDDNGGSGTWTYNFANQTGVVITSIMKDGFIPEGTETAHPTTTVTAPGYPTDNDTDHIFTAANLGTDLEYCTNFAETETDEYNGTGSGSRTLLKKTTRLFNQEVAEPISTQAPYNSQPSSKTETLTNGAAVTTTYTYPTLFSLYIPGCTNYMDTTDCSEPPLESSSPVNFGQPKTQTITSADANSQKTIQTAYKWQSDSTFFSNNFLSYPLTAETDSAAPAEAGKTTYGYDETTANLTSVSKDLVASGGSITTETIDYNAQGMPKYTYDSKLNKTTIYYEGSGLFPREIDRPVTGTGGVPHIDYYSYDDNSGNVNSHTDENGSTTNYSYDIMGRLTLVMAPPTVAGQANTNYCYTDIGGTGCSAGSAPYSVYATTIASPDPTQRVVRNYDGLGRLIRTTMASDPEGAVSTDTVYNGDGQVAEVSNPYRGSATAWTQYAYDGLGRVAIQTQPDHSMLSWCYNGVMTNGQTCGSFLGSGTPYTWTDSIDEVGNHWQRSSDYFSNLTQVLEPNPTSNVPTLSTTYQYNALNNLTGVNQAGISGSDTPRTRTFTYDGLSRLLSAANPESGTTNYYYTTYPGGGLCSGDVSIPCSKTDARGVTINYSPSASPIDALNRVTMKTYSDGSPSVGYVYDLPSSYTSTPNNTGNFSGRLSSVTTTLADSTVESAKYISGYDALGRLSGFIECGAYSGDCTNSTGEVAFSADYSYDLAGNVIALNTGIGQLGQLTPENSDQSAYRYFSWDAAGRLTTAEANTDLSPGSLDFQATAYSPFGGLTAANFPDENNNPLINMSRSYDPYRMWLSSESDSSPTAGGLYSYALSFQANGNVNGVNDSVMGTSSLPAVPASPAMSATYDHLNRLTSAAYTAGSYSGLTLSWNYDDFGNRTGQTPSGTTYMGRVPTGETLGFTDATNHITSGLSISYDGAGNVSDDGTNQYLYDGEGLLCAMEVGPGLPTSGAMTGYIYDGDGNRVAKGSISTLSCDSTSNGFTLSNAYTVGPSGEQLDEADATGTEVHSNTFANGKLLSTYDNITSEWTVALNDWLGTKRVQVDPAIAANLTSFTSLTYGDALTPGGYDATEQHFTGKERDQESGNDYFGARYYASTTGRFLTPDPMNLSAVFHPDDPQSWNGYSYGRNNPLTNTDPTGEVYTVCDNNGNCTAGILDQTFDSEKQQDIQNGERFNNGQMYHFDDNGNKVNDGTYQQTDVDSPGLSGPANLAGAQFLYNQTRPAVNILGAATGAMVGAGMTAEAAPVATGIARWGLQRLAMSATAPALVNLINRLYQAQDEIPGGTAGAVRNEVMTGEYINGGHAIKASEMITALQNLIKSGTLSGSDQMIAGHIISDLKNSLGR